MHFIGVKFYKTAFKFFQGFGPCSLFVKVFQAIAPLNKKCIEFLIKFVSGLGRMVFSFLLRPEFLCKNKSLNSVTV